MADQLSTLVSLMGLLNSGRGAASGTTTNGDTTSTVSGGGGTTSMSGYSSPGETTELRNLIAELGQADYGKVLEQIFQQAAGQIPGFQRAFSNAVGARSGNNSAVNGILQQLLQQTVLAGQKQTAELQLQNSGQRGNLAQAIAAATKGTHTRQVTSQRQNPTTQRNVTTNVQTPTKEPYGAGDLAKMMAVLTMGNNAWQAVKGKFGEQGDPVDLAGANYGGTGNIADSGIGGDFSSPPIDPNYGSFTNFLSGGNNNLFANTMGQNQIWNFNGIDSAPSYQLPQVDYGDVSSGGFDMGAIDDFVNSSDFTMPDFDFGGGGNIDWGGNWGGTGDMASLGDYDMSQEFWF